MFCSFEFHISRRERELTLSQSHEKISLCSRWITEIDMTQEKVIEAEVIEPKVAEECDWLKKVDELSVGEIRKKYPKAFWIAGGAIILALIL